MKKRPKKHRHRTRSCTEDETNIKLNTLFKDFFNILEDSPQPEEGFDTGSQEYRLAMLWLNKLVAMPCLTLLDGEIRNSYMSQLSACISQRRLCGIFEQMPPATLERMEFREIAQQTVQRTTSCQNAGAMHDTMQSQSQSNERLEELTTPRPHTTSLQPFDMESESMGEAQQHMQQTMDEPLEHPYESTTSLEPYEMTSDSCNQSLGGSQRPQEDTLDEGIQYFDPRLASPSSNDSSCNMESRTLKHFMDRAQHHLEQTLEEPQHLFDPREYPPTTLLEPTEIRRDAFSQSLGVDQQPIEDTTDENITYFDADLSSRSPHKGSSNMESRTLKHFMDRAQHHLEQGTSLPRTSSQLEPSGMRCHIMDQSMRGYGDQLEEDAMAEGIKIPDSPLSLLSSHEGPANMENRDFNQSMVGDQQPMEDAMDGSGEASSSMQCIAFNQSFEEFLHHMQRTMDEIGKHLDQSDAYPMSTTSMEPCETTRRSINQSIDGDQQPTEVIPLLNPSSLDVDPCHMEYQVFDQPAGGEECLWEGNMNEGNEIFESALSSSLSDEDTCKVEYRDFNQSMGGDQHPMEHTTDENITYFDADLSTRSPHKGSSNMESRTLKHFMDRAQHHLEQTLEEPQHLFDPREYPPTTLLEPTEIRRDAFSQSMGGDQHPMEDTTDENITYFDADLSSRSPHKGSSNMESRTLKHFMDRAQHHLEQGTSLPRTSSQLEPSGMRCHIMDQSMRGYGDQLEEDAMAEGIKIPDSPLSLLSSHEGPANMENRDFNQSMVGDQQPMEDAMDGSGEASSSVQCIAFKQSFEEFLHHMQRTMDEIGKHLDQSDVYPMSTTSMEPCETTRRSINQSIDGDQQPTEVIPFLNPSSLDVDPCHMEYQVFDQPAGGEECLWEDNMNEGNEIFESALSSSLSDEDTCKVEYRDFNQWNSMEPSEMRRDSFSQSLGGDQQPMEDAMDGSGDVSSRVEYRAFNQFLDESLHHMQRTMDEIGKHLDQSDAYPMSTTSMEPCEMTRRSINQSIDGDQQPTEVIPFLNPSSLEVGPCHMEYQVFDQPADGEECLWEDNMNEGNEIFESALSSSLSDEDTCTVEYREFNQSMGGDQHPMDTMGKRGESITFFDPKLSPPSPLEEELSDTELPSFRQYISSGVHLPDTTMGGGLPQFKKTTKDASQFHDSVHPAGIEKPMVSSQNVMQETLLGIQKIFKSANGATKPSLGSHPVGQSGMGKFSFNQSVGGPQQLMQRMLGGAELGDEKTKRAPQKMQNSPLESPADMDVYPWVSMRRGISKSMSCPQIVMLSTLEEPSKCHDNTKLEAQQLEKGSRPGTGPGTGTGPGPGKMEQPSLPVERPKLLRHKTMDIAQQGDKNNKADAPTFECPGPSGMGSYLWDSMGRAIGKSISGLQMLMQNATDESLNGHGKIGSGFQKLNAVINGDFVTSDMVGRRHFGCLSCFDASPKCNRQAPDARSTCCDGSHYPIPYPIAHEEASAGPAVTFSKERRTHKPDDEQRKDLLHILETVQGELRGAATVGHDDCLEKEMLRYRDWLTKTKERKLKKITRGGNAIAVRRYLLQSMEKDLLDLLK